MSAEVAVGIVAILAASGTGVLAYAVLGSAAEVARRLVVGRFRWSLDAVRQRLEAEGRSSLEEIGGLPRRLAPWMLVCAVVGFLATMALVPEGPARTIGLSAGVLPLLWKRRRFSALRQEIRREVADLLEDIRLQMAFGGSLAVSLSVLAESGGGGLVRQRLRAHRETLWLRGPEETLRRIAVELESPELRMFLARLEMARHGQGQASYGQILERAVGDAVHEGRRRAEEEIEGAPLRLLLPMLFFLFPPVLVMVLYPPAYALISQLAGAGSSAVIP